MVERDRDNPHAKELLRAHSPHVTTDHVVIETWFLLKSRHSQSAGMRFWDRVRTGAVRIEFATAGDLRQAWRISQAFPDQDFSIVDCTSFAVMERLGIRTVLTFDHHFSVYRYGLGRNQAFEVLA